MKTLKKIGFIFLILFAVKATAQTDKTTTAKIVAEKNYVFVATSALPMNAAEVNSILGRLPGGGSGSNINLAGNNYNVRITADSVIAYLPYFGRSYSAPIGSDDNGFKFTSTSFSYTSDKRKKGWQVRIEPKDTKDSPQLSLSISESGYGSLVVSSNNKQSITYNGYLKEIDKKN